MCKQLEVRTLVLRAIQEPRPRSNRQKRRGTAVKCFFSHSDSEGKQESGDDRSYGIAIPYGHTSGLPERIMCSRPTY
jgi:hypothetical protein